MNISFLYILLAAINSTIGNLLLKRSRMVVSEDVSGIQDYLSFYFLGALHFYGLNVFLFARALEDIPVNIAYPVLASSGFAMLWVGSFVFFGEKLTTLQLTGVLVIIVGIALLTFDNSYR